MSEATEIDEAMIERLVRAFYDRVRADTELGPVFESRIAEWEPHLLRMFSFWSSVMLKSGRYHGSPMQKHAELPVDAEHFDRWLELFERAARELTPAAAAERFVAAARRIAESLELGLAFRHGVMLPKGGRFRRGENATSPAPGPGSSEPARRGAD